MRVPISYFSVVTDEDLQQYISPVTVHVRRKIHLNFLESQDIVLQNNSMRIPEREEVVFTLKS